MSRKSDIELAWAVYAIDDDTETMLDAIDRAINAAYDLGRAAQAEKNLTDLRGRHWMWCEDKWESIAKRLRAKVRKMLEESK